MHGTADSNGTAAMTLTGLRVLVAEDRSLIATKVVQVLCQAECVPVGPVATLEAGLDLAGREGVVLDAAVLDIDLRGKLVYPLAEALRTRNVPILLLTGYGDLAIPEPWRGVARVEKPFDGSALLRGLRAAILGGPAGAVTRGAPAAIQASRVLRQAWEAIRSSRDLLTETRILLDKGGPGQNG